jgi:hypothetical protein
LYLNLTLPSISQVLGRIDKLIRRLKTCQNQANGFREDFEAFLELLSRFKKRLRDTENGLKNESLVRWRLIFRIMESKSVSTERGTERITVQRDRKSIVGSTAQIRSLPMTIAAIS